MLCQQLSKSVGYGRSCTQTIATLSVWRHCARALTEKVQQLEETNKALIEEDQLYYETKEDWT